jgi:hypothetical protein
MKRCELDLDDPPAPLAGKVEAGIDGEAIEPGVEPVGISKLLEIPPGPDQRLLDRVACELGVPEDEASGLVQPHDGGASELGEGVMIASVCPLHEPSLVHGRLAHRTRPQRSCLITYGDEIRFLVLPAKRPAPQALRKGSGFVDAVSASSMKLDLEPVVWLKVDALPFVSQQAS